MRVNVLGYICLLISLVACRSLMRRNGDSGYTLYEPTPPGMIKVPRGHITLGQEVDSIWSDISFKKSVSVDAFFMDRHEVTNAQYRKFVYYVRDSILRERLADPKYAGDERYKIVEDREGNVIKPQLNWSIPLPSISKATEEELVAINSLYRDNPLTGRKELDPNQLLYRYEVYDYKAAAYYKGLLYPTERNTNWHQVEQLPIIVKDTAYINTRGEVVRDRITRTLGGVYDFINTYIVAIHPDEDVWIRDWVGSSNEKYTKYYFQHKGYDDYPVVGVTWEQANAYCAWRTEQEVKNNKVDVGYHIEPYRLPTAAEYEYAARSGKDKLLYPWNSSNMLDSGDCLCANFKPAEGNYTADKHLITAPVKSYAPNDYGLYDMGGNVAEWTSTAWHASAFKFIDDVNPDINYKASKTDAYIHTLKLVKGGSWKDIAKYVMPSSIATEYQDQGRSYIGFRCVRSMLDFDR